MSGTVNPRARGRAVRRTVLTRLATVTLGLATAATIAGCGAGQITQTSSQQAGVNGANVTGGDIAVRNAELAYPEEKRYYTIGDDIPVQLTIVNQGPTQDELAAVRSPAAEGVRISGDTTLPGGTALRAAFEAGEAEPSEGAEAPGSSAAAPGSSAAAPSGSAVPSPTEAKPTGTEDDIGKVTITVIGLQEREVRPGEKLPLIFDFARAGDIKVEVPIANPEGPPEH